MSMKIRYIILLVGFFIMAQSAVSQIPTEAEAKEQLEKKGIDEEELKTELLSRGVDLDNIDTTNPIELLRVRKIVEEVMAKLEKKGKEKTNEKKDTIKTNTENILSSEGEIKDAVKDGATLDEAISEEIHEKEKKKLPEAQVYGHHLFRNNSVKFYRKSEDAKPPNTYIIGPGDRVSVAIWGIAEYNFSQEVSRDGFIKPDKASRIYIAGLTIEEAKKAIKSKMSRNYPFTDNTFEVNVVTSRTINVNITGEVFNVGSYSISALNTAFNALVSAGGPSDIGSVRKIKVVRAGGKTKTLDIYKYLTNPLINEDFYLQDNDYIVVPVAEKVVNIRGAINRPYKYELLDNENLNELLSYAGGLKARALRRSFKVKRVENDKEVIINVNYADLSKLRKNFQLIN